MWLYVFILVEIFGGSPRQLEKNISRIHGVVEARSVYGSRYDVVVRARAKSREECNNIVDSIQKLHGRIYTSTLEAGVEKSKKGSTESDTTEDNLGT
jgi:DNA-binding Lrp family transcriptional regulator